MKTRQSLSLLFIFILIFSLTLFPLDAKADVVLKSYKQPLELVLGSDLFINKSKIGDPYTIVFPETILYQDHIIQAKSRFEGHITAIKLTKRYNRHGYFKLDLEQFCTPDSKCLKVSDILYSPVYIKLYSSGVLVEKNYGSGIFGPVIFVGEIALDFIIPGVGAALMSIGSIKTEFNKDVKKKKSLIKKIGTGLWESTGIPYVIRFSKVDKNPEYQAGQHIELKINERILYEIFSYTSSFEQAQTDLPKK